MIGIADLAAILTVAGVSIYVLGLVGLAITIRLRLACNISIAWYAVSLLPRPVIVGHGVRIWLTWPIVLTIVLLPAAYWAGTRAAQLRSKLPDLFVIVAILIVVGITTLVILFRIVRREGGIIMLPSLVSRAGQSIYSLGTIPKLIGTVTMIMIGSVVMIVAALLISDGIIGAPIISPATRQIVVGIILLFVGGFFVGVPVALTVETPLPHIEVTKKNRCVARGHLVNHSEGFWHLFVVPNSDKTLRLHERSHELWSIPDAEVLAVRTVGKRE